MNEQDTIGNDQPAQLAKRTIVHVQVAGNPDATYLQQVAEHFSKTVQANGDSVITTADNIQTTKLHMDEGEAIAAVMVQGCIDVVTIAMVAHNVNQSYAEALGETPVLWADATEAQRQSMVKGVLFRLHNPNTTPEEQHNAWYEARRADGWTYGEIKDEAKKTNPAFLSYAALPQAQRVKDFLFAGVVNSLRDRLPNPNPQVSPIQTVERDGTVVDANFMELTTGTVFRFTGQDKFFKAIGVPYVNYADFTKAIPSWNIDVEPLEMRARYEVAEANVQDPDLNGRDTITDVEFVDEDTALTAVKVDDEEDEAFDNPWIQEDGLIKHA